ncbi:unnamed protein product [Phytophthora fragariaefolia]|uniref:Unnamed protein product n=1 Tax=Phytophthora fragariaefolia TaxID=1490495 RepID=A0A9W6XTU4_9STRA|nr:unnamed protein product [Phytophthora fragariaefolia]
MHRGGGEVSPSEPSCRRRLRRRATTVESVQNREVVNVVEYEKGSPNRVRTIEVANPPSDAAAITRLPGLSWKHFDLRAREIERICLFTSSDQPAVLANTVYDDASSSRPKAAEPKSVREEHFAAQSWTALQDSNNPVYSLAREFKDIFPEKIPAELPVERGVRHEIDLMPGSKYCVTRQWPLPRDQVQAIVDFFEGRRKAGHVRESTSPHSSPTICVKKATGGWRIVHAFNKLNDATIPAQTPIPHKDMVLDTMSGSIIFSAIDLTDGCYEILMRECDIPLTAVSTPSGMLWEWLPMSSLLKKDVAWNWRPEHQDAFKAVKESLASAPVLLLPDTSRPFHVVCDASDFAIGCALMQFDDEGRERVVSYQPRQMKPAERKYPVHDKELLAMRYALIKFRVYLLGEQTFGGDSDNEDDDEDCAVCVELGINATVSSPVLPLRQQIADAYDDDAFYAGIIRYLRNPAADALAKLTRPTRDTITRYALGGDLVTYAIDTFDTPRVVIPADDDLRVRLVHEYHDAPAGGQLGREMTFASIFRDCFWPRMTMDFIFGLPRDAQGRTGILVFDDRFSKMVHLAPVAAEVTADESAELFLDLVFRHHGLQESIVSDRDPRFTSAFWTRLFAGLVRSSNPPAVSTLGGGGRVPTPQSVQSSSEPPSDELHQETAAEVHVVVGHALHGVAYEELAVVDAAMPTASTVANFAPTPTPTPIDSATVSELLLHRQAVTRYVRDTLQAAADQQKANADRRDRKNMLSFRRGDRVLLSTDGIQCSVVTNLGANKLAPRFIGPFKILKRYW